MSGSGSAQQQYGNETRTAILPTADTAQLGYLGPQFDPTDELLIPSQIGVRNEGTMGATIDAAKGAAWYADMIGFGGPSTDFTRSMDVKPYPIGVNYFLRTSQQCSNGADMWEYIEGIPRGDMLGKKITSALEALGYPPMKGMAAGMIEDAQAALNPGPMIRAMFGSAYPRCKQVTSRVGSSMNKIKNDEGKSYVEDPGSVEYKNGVPYQTRWVLDEYVEREKWEKDQKIYERDGTARSFKGQDEGFCGEGQLGALGFTAGALFLLFLYLSRNRGN
jgi:hypothetical protein